MNTCCEAQDELNQVDCLYASFILNSLSLLINQLTIGQVPNHFLPHSPSAVSNFKSAAISCHFSAKSLPPSSTPFTLTSSCVCTQAELIRSLLFITSRSSTFPSFLNHHQWGFLLMSQFGIWSVLSLSMHHRQFCIFEYAFVNYTMAMANILKVMCAFKVR